MNIKKSEEEHKKILLMNHKYLCWQKFLKNACNLVINLLGAHGI